MAEKKKPSKPGKMTRRSKREALGKKELSEAKAAQLAAARAAKAEKRAQEVAPWRFGAGGPMKCVYEGATEGNALSDIITILSLEESMTDPDFKHDVQQAYRKGRAQHRVVVQADLNRSAREGKSNAVRLQAESILEQFKEGNTELEQVMLDGPALKRKVFATLKKLNLHLNAGGNLGHLNAGRTYQASLTLDIDPETWRPKKFDLGLRETELWHDVLYICQQSGPKFIDWVRLGERDLAPTKVYVFQGHHVEITRFVGTGVRGVEL